MNDFKLKGAALPPQLCQNMGQVRAGVDATDAELIALLARRFAYMAAAARIKTDRNIVRDEARKAQVIENAGELAGKAGIPVDLVHQLWDLLVEGSIAYELVRWDELNAG